MLRAAQDVYDRYGQEIDAKLINKGDDRLYTMPVL
jgi:recG-like helicase